MRIALAAICLTLQACAWITPLEKTGETGNHDADGDGHEDLASGGDDCDDGDATIHPDADERCNHLDDDCDGEVDEDPVDGLAWYLDNDGDGYGMEGSAPLLACKQPRGRSSLGTDCDDGDAEVHPGAQEICGNTRDDDCDGIGTMETWVAPGEGTPLQIALEEADNGDLICASAGTYVENLTFGARWLHLLGAEGAENTFIDGNAAGPVADFTLHVDTTTVFEGFTLQNGSAPDGGGVHISGVSPTLRRLVITGSQAQYGGGISVYMASPVLEDITLTGNYATVDGGGLSISNQSNPVLLRVMVSTNTADGMGGGISISDASAPSLSNVTVSENTAALGGGGLSISDASDASILSSSIENNTTGGRGNGSGVLVQRGADPLLEELTISGNWPSSGLWIADSAPQVVSSTITRNEGEMGGGCVVTGTAAPTFQDVLISLNYAKLSGGGLSIEAGATPTFSRVEITANTAKECGGGLQVSLASPALSGLNILTNQADQAGGGVVLIDASPTLSDLLIAGNQAEQGAGGLQVRGGDAMLHNVKICGNRSSVQGGGVQVESCGTLSLSNTAITGNSADEWAGGLDLAGPEPCAVTLENTVVAGNSAGGDGGGILLTAGALTLRNTILSDNHSLAVGGLLVENGAPDVLYSVLWANTPQSVAGMADPQGTGGNLSADPQFLDATADDACDWDLHLATGSALLDVGDPNPLDPDGGRSDPGLFGGPGAAGWDMDGDGAPSWWQPGAYDVDTYPGAGWDCDDNDPEVMPPKGCMH